VFFVLVAADSSTLGDKQREIRRKTPLRSDTGRGQQLWGRSDRIGTKHTISTDRYDVGEGLALEAQACTW